MAAATPFIPKAEVQNALSKAFNYLETMVVHGAATAEHAQAKGLIKMVHDSLGAIIAEEKRIVEALLGEKAKLLKEIEDLKLGLPELVGEAKAAADQIKQDVETLKS